MKQLKFLAPALLLFTAIFGAPSVQAGELQIGQQLSAITLPDQHEKNQTIDGKTRFVIFARDKESSTLIHGLLEPAGADYLTERQAVYLADISGMPGIIRNLFAMPKMRKYPYRIMLDLEAKETKDFPGKAGQATLIRLNGLKIEKIEFLSTPEDLKRALSNAPSAINESPTSAVSPKK